MKKNYSNLVKNILLFSNQSITGSLLLLVLLFVSLVSFGQGSQIYTTAGSHTFTVPAGVTTLTVECWGGGGAGGGANETGSNVTRAGGGGGGGAYTKNTAVSVTPGQIITFAVGGGGTGRTSSDSGGAGSGNGNDGSASAFLTVTAAGGKGGVEGNSANAYGTGGAGGVGGTWSGGSGQTASNGDSGGGGGSAGTGSNGNTGALTGAAAVTGGGGGAKGKKSNQGDGENALDFGGGGGGALMKGNNSDDYKGGNGGNGKVVVSWTCSTFSLTSTTATTPICSSSTATVTLANTTTTNLPVGTYTVTYNLSGANTATGSTATMTVSTAGSGTFTTSALANSGNTTITVTQLQTSSCTSAITANNTATIVVNSTISPMSQVGATQTFCTDNGTTFTSGNANAGQYVLVNVVRGFKYTFSVGNVFSGFSENLTILDASNDANVSPATSATGASGATITDWSSSLSGQIKVVLSAGGCSSNNGTTGSSGITVTQTAIGNNLDSQAAYGTNTWVGHVYNAGNAAPTINTANYVGYYTINSETISEGFGGSYACFPVYSNGTQRASIYTEGFAVIYKMKTTKNGCYLITINGDDGVRLKLNGTTILDRWVEQSNTTYSNVLVTLDGDDDLILEYYENGGDNVVGFSMASFAISGNTITPASNCKTNGTDLLLDGSSYLVNGQGNTYLTYQWQTSNDNSAWSDIGSATAEDYTIPATANLTATTYYRRIVKGSQSYNNGCSVTSSSVAISPVSVGGTVSSAQTICAGTQPANLTLSGHTGSITKWQKSTDAAFTSPVDIANTTTTLAGSTIGTLNANTYFRAVVQSGSCTVANSASVLITVNPVTVGGTVSSAQVICSGTQPANLTLSGHTGSVTKWQRSTDAAFTSPTDISNTTTILNDYTIGNLTASTYFRAVVQSGSCAVAYSASVLVTVNPTPTLTGASQVTAVCAGSTATVNLTGLLANSTSTINYTINGAAQTPVTNVVANASGGGSFSTPVLSAANNGQYLQITGVTTTSATPNCTAGLYYGFNLQVNAVPSAPGTSGPHSPYCSGFTAQWGSVGNATKYYLDVSTSSSFSSFVTGYNNFDVGNNTSYALSGLNPGTVYHYRVRASNNCGASGSSSTMSINTTESPIAAPVAKAISNPNCTDVQLNWDPVTYATGYYVDIATDSAFTSFVSGYNSFYVGYNNYYASGLPGGTLHYRLRATNSCGVTTGNSNTITFSNQGSAGGTISSAHSICYNAQPSNLTLSGHVGTILKWQKSTNLAFTSPVDIANTTTTLTGAEIGNLTANTYIRAVVQNGYCAAVNSSPVLITVNVLPTLTGALQPLVACDGAATTINLSNLLANSVFSVNYTINGVAQTAVTGVAADASGNASYTTGILSLANNGHVLQVTGITNSTTGCTATFARNVTLNVKSDVGSISVNGGTPIASNGNVMYCPSTTAVFSLAAVSGASTYTWAVPSGWAIQSGQGTTSITVSTGSSSQSGNVSVHTDNIICPSNLWADLSGITSGAPSTQITKLPICSDPFASIEITSPAPASGISYTVTGISPAVAAVTNSTGKFTGLTPGNYEVRYQTNSGCTSAAFLQTIAGVPSTTLTSSGWSNGAPDSTKDAIFDVDVTIQEETIDACSCQVKAGKNIQVKSNGVLKLVNSLNVSGTITFDDSTSLVQINDNAVNTGSITYKRTTSAIKDFDYVYWSSPVKDQVLNTLSPLTDKYWSWASGAWAAEARTNDMNPAGKGFIIRVPRYVTSQSVIFEGVPNNGVVNIPTQGTDQNNLIGNPYPSAIDADAFINANSTIISGALYFWTHNTARAVNGGGTAMIYVSDDYATYTLTGGAGTEPSTSKNSSGNKVGFDGDIAAGQSFFVGSKGVGNFVFNNGMRISDSGKNSQFFKQTATKKEAKVEKSRIWLNLTNAEGAFKQLLVGYITGATNEKDNLYDGVSNNANKFIDFYSQDNSQKYTIQGRALPFVPTDEVPLGYKSTIEGSFKISIENTDGVLTNQEVYLEDKQTNIIHNLKSGDYSFSTTQGEFKDRFVLRYTGKTLGIGDVEMPAKGKGVIVSAKNKQIKINSFDEPIKSVKVYDLKGSLVYNKEKLSGNEFVISQLTSSDQFLIVMIQLESGKWHSEEVIYQN